MDARALWAMAGGFWLFVAAVSAVQIVWVSQTPGHQLDVRGAMVWQTIYIVSWVPFTVAIWQLTRRWVPERFRGWTGLLLAHVAVATIVTLTHTLVVAQLSVWLSNPMMARNQGFLAQVRDRLTLQLLIYTAIAGSGAAITLHERYRDRQLAATRLEGELATARLQALRGHLQPHFLFNSLHSIAALARSGDTAGVVRLTSSLSDLLRHVLDAGDRHAPLREELEIVERYLDIQRARFPDRLEVTVDLAAEVADARVPLLVVQPLVENAVRHGLAPQVKAGTLVVRAARDNGTTRIDVEDSGVGLPPGWSLDRSTGTGLRNLSSRLAAEFGESAALVVAPRPGGGVRATVTLPYVTS